MGNKGFSDGFLMGALVGSAATFLFTTKKGNKILSVISEQGISGLSDLIEDLEDRRDGLAPEPEEYVEDEIILETPKEAVAHASVAAKKRFFKKKS